MRGAAKRPGGVDRALGKTDPWGGRVGKRTQQNGLFKISVVAARKIFQKSQPVLSSVFVAMADSRSTDPLPLIYSGCVGMSATLA
jgi:hypothetical protein